MIFGHVEKRLDEKYKAKYKANFEINDVTAWL